MKESLRSLDNKSSSVTGEVAAIVEGMGSTEEQHHTAGDGLYQKVNRYR